MIKKIPFKLCFSPRRFFMLAVGLLVLLNLRSELNIWWLDVRFMGWLLRPVFFGVIGLVLLSAGIFYKKFYPVTSAAKFPKWLLRGVCWAAGFLAAVNAISYYVMLAKGDFTTLLPIPFSLFVAVFFIWLAWPVKKDVKTGWRACVSFVVSAAVLFGALPLGQMLMFGKTDYRRTADVAVVFGAGVDKDGNLSLALQDRTDTAIGLYKEGLVGKLLFSGGPGPGQVSETQAMRDYAVRKGVNPAGIIIDPAGLDTHCTVENTQKICKTRGYNTVLAVSHFYHLPRMKMTYQKAGLEVYTVPARESWPLTWMPYFMLREAAAIWVYYLT